MGFCAIITNPKYYNILIYKIIIGVTYAASFLGAAGRIIFRIEINDDFFAPVR